jgi:hypothetical protein
MAVVKYSCVLDHPPRYARQALTWAASLLTYGGQDADSLVIHAVESCHPGLRRLVNSWGIETRNVKRFDPAYPHSNKLAQLESGALAGCDYVVLCDCDIVFCDSISLWIKGGSVRARVPSYAGLRQAQWERLFARAKLQLPVTRVTAVLDGAETLPIYCNGALHIIPQAILRRLQGVWPKWARWLSARPALFWPLRTYIDQIAFTLSCAELDLALDYLPVELNFPVRILPKGQLYRAGARGGTLPMVLHHHHRDREGLLLMTNSPGLNAQIRRINDMIYLIQRTGFRRPDSLRRRAIDPGAYRPDVGV